MSNFRSVPFWKEAIMTLPDNAFFELLRTVFGKIKTPFNKQILAEDLERFLTRKDIKNNIAGFIDTPDARIISAVAVLDEPSQSDLENFFTGELNRSEVHDLVINLEERFILYRFFEKEDSPGRLALNPVLESILSPFAGDSSLLFPSVPVEETHGSPQSAHSPVNDRIFAALLSFVFQNKVFFKPGGMIRQKAANTAKTLFPDLAKAGLSLETIIGGLRVLGLFFAEGETLTPDHNRFAAFGLVSRQERLVYCAAGILCYADWIEGATTAAFSPWLFRTKIGDYAQLINRLYNALDPQRLYPCGTLQKMAYMQTNNGRILDVMEKIGLIIPVETYWQKASIAEGAHSGKNAVIAMDTPFTLLVYPEIAYNDVISLAAFANVIEAGMTVRFELSRDSAVTAFNRGFSAAQIIERLQLLSHNRMSENVAFTLSDWEKRHGEVTLRRAVVLTLSPEQRHLAQTAPLAKLIVETPAPGVYFLPESAEEKAVEALRKAGVAIIARREESGPPLPAESSSEQTYHFFPPLKPEKTHARAAREHNPPDGDPSSALTASTLTEGFRSILDTMRLGKEERDELSARIDRRLVLCESQLKDAVVRYEKLEARGLDYVGKAMIAKQAISLQSPVEVTWTAKQKQERAFGIPKALEKSGGESILVIEPLDGGDTIRLSLGKISLLRRIKKSIFEGS